MAGPLTALKSTSPVDALMPQGAEGDEGEIEMAEDDPDLLTELEQEANALESEFAGV